jgi:hypothetical protein
VRGGSPGCICHGREAILYSSQGQTCFMTKTVNPLHFEDLEPHRFEDLVRQVIYDFKEWSSLEPTGRLGADDGYDARGFEIVKDSTGSDQDTDAEEDDQEVVEKEERLWQIQCKREKSISPSKITQYVDEMIPKGCVVPYPRCPARCESGSTCSRRGSPTNCSRDSATTLRHRCAIARSSRSSHYTLPSTLATHAKLRRVPHASFF